MIEQTVYAVGGRGSSPGPQRRQFSTEAAYMRSDLFDQRRALMDRWAAYVTGRNQHKEENNG